VTISSKIVLSTLVLALVPMYADVVAGSETGQFLNPVMNSSNVNDGTAVDNTGPAVQWFWWGDFFNPDSLTFTPQAFGPATTPTGLLDFGQLSLIDVSGTVATETVTADLGVTLNFTTPPGQNVPLAFNNLEVIAIPNDFNILVNLPNNIPSQQFTVGSTTYTVNLAGFYQGNNQVTSLFAEQGDGAVTAELKGSITSVTQSAVPEPTSVLLLGTLMVGISTVLRRRRTQA
jgi:hypothetical protein